MMGADVNDPLEIDGVEDPPARAGRMVGSDTGTDQP
jgi:hypothetical protein